jgi:hypothetical protein
MNMLTALVTRIRVCLVCGTVLWLTSVAVSADAAPPAGPEPASGWDRLDLVRTTIAGTEVYYERVLEPNLPFLEHEVTRFADNRSALIGALAKRDDIIADINRILGIPDPHVDDQNRDFMQIATTGSQMKLAFYFVTQTTIKDFLRSGGQLPSFSYDRRSDTVLHEPRLYMAPGQEAPERREVCVPVPSGEELEKQVSGTLRGVGRFFGPGMVEIAIHEVTELTLLRRARPMGPYWRWFSDGFANAITCLLIEEHLSGEAAGRFAKGYDPNACRDLERQINLRYWMLGNFSVYVSRAPTKTESKIQQARYTYSMFEAQRLIELHGIDCVRKILDAIAAKDSRTGDDLLRVIQDVTGEDMEVRLGRYQTFATPEEGLRTYGAAIKTAASQDDYEQMLLNLLRIMELRGDTFTGETIQWFLNAALMLVRMGHEAAADEAMRTCIRLSETMIPKEGRRLGNEAFVIYALDSGRPQKARQAAEELLELNPRHILALSAQMLIALQDGNLAQAKEYAVQVRDSSPKGSHAHKKALEILAMDTDQPSPDH